MEELQGYVDHIVFRNADNGYTVLNLSLRRGRFFYYMENTRRIRPTESSFR